MSYIICSQTLQPWKAKDKGGKQANVMWIYAETGANILQWTEVHDERERLARISNVSKAIVANFIAIQIWSRVARRCEISHVLPKITVFQKNCQLFWQYFYAKILPFFQIPIVSIDKTINFGLCFNEYINFTMQNNINRI